MQNLNYSLNTKHNYVQNNSATVIPYQKKYEIKPEHKKLKTKQKEKKNSFVSFCFWGIVMTLSLSVCLENFLFPVYINRVKNQNLNFDAKEVYAPTLKYINNLNFLGENLLAPVPVKGKEKIAPIISNGEITPLKNEIEGILSNYKNMHAGVFVYDYTTGKTVEINSDEIFPSASIIKIPVLLDLFNRSKNLEKEGFAPIDLDKKLTFTEAHRTEGSGKLQFTKADTDYSLDYLAKIMIRQSDNSATNMLVEEIGGIGELNSSLRHWGFSKTQMSNWLPDLRGTNTTTPKDISTMLYNIDNQKFIPISSSANIKEYMSKVENRTLIKSQMPDDVVLVHKTGDIGTMLGDAGIIFTPSGKRFILTIMVKRPHNDYGARELIQKVSKAVYNSLS